VARPLGIEYSGANYHVMNRGNLQEDIFLTDRDRQVFLGGLADSCETYRIKLSAYVLMPNH
jgi:REP element-mobilizing transposase RayT